MTVGVLGALTKFMSLDESLQVATQLLQANELADVASDLASSIGSAFRWDIARVWNVDHAASAVRPVAVWHSDRVSAADAAGPRIDETMYGRFFTGESLVGDVLQHGARWIDDLSAQTTLRRHEYASTGMRSGVFVPIGSSEYVIGVLELLSRRRRPHDAEVLRTVNEVNLAIGGFLVDRELVRDPSCVDRMATAVSNIDAAQRSLANASKRIESFLSAQTGLRSTLGEERRARELAYRATVIAESRFRALFDSDAIGMSISSADGGLGEVNAAFARILGYTRDEMCRIGWRALTPTDQAWFDERALEQLATDGVARTYEKDLFHKDGSRVPILLGCAQMSDGQIISYILDNSGRKRAEAALAQLNQDLQHRIADSASELRQLASHVQTVREEQSTHIAREIHDVLGQELTGLRMDAAWVARRLGETHGPECERLAAMQIRIDGLITAVRAIATELRPKMLDDLGLGPALEWQAREWATRSGVAVEIEVPAQLDIDRARATAMFRIFQELLTNVARHAGAKKIRVQLTATADCLMLDFEDDGCGMTPAAISGSLGLLGIRERLITFGGELSINSTPGHGTLVWIRLPLEHLCES